MAQQPGVVTVQQGSLDLIFDVAQRELVSQFEILASNDTKAGIALGFAGVVLAILAGAILSSNKTVIGWSLYLLIGAITLIFAGAVCAVIVLWVTRYDKPPKLKGLVDKYLAKPQEITKTEIVNVIRDAVENNWKRIGVKGILINVSLSLQVCGIFLLAVSFAPNILAK